MISYNDNAMLKIRFHAVGKSNRTIKHTKRIHFETTHKALADAFIGIVKDF